jgi:hypothetical protein
MQSFEPLFRLEPKIAVSDNSHQTETIKTAEEYLKCVRNWKDPFTTPVLENFDGVTVVRDDLIRLSTKARYFDALIANKPDVREWVTGSSSRFGFTQVSLAYACKHRQKKSAVFIAKSNELHSNTKRAIAFGAKVTQVPMGFLAVTQARAAEYARASNDRSLLSIDLPYDAIYGAIIKIARALPFKPQEVWTVAGGGALNRGLQLAWPDADVYMVAVGHEMTPKQTGRATVFRHYLKQLSQPCRKEFLPPFPSSREYDAKAWEFIQQHAHKNRRVLFWNVA